ncbi:molecular chaperone TorD family protein [Methylonatrum kenyense]|uniref:TorD/DmsD family molecular chaperone n=1 Tax=Methylonatrum kenyense TaxID=455253 RepID=UPI0020BFB3A4|nr:molecular chaperone TorD family protein [Methylonatrum kenyense]MCK8514807.1 molecular chaperone TorD family protein [Methylonatrum kenyense]
MSTGNGAQAVTAEDMGDNALRAGVWRLLAALLAAAPDAQRLELLRGLEVPMDAAAEDDGMGGAWAALLEVARVAEPEALRREYQDVFIGVGGGEITPYASYYGSGQLMDRALIDLRRDLAMLGISRHDDTSEPEDHAAAVCEAMALAIEDAEVDMAWQREFYERHIASWMGDLMKDLKAAGSARFYRGVAVFGQAFITLEGRYLDRAGAEGEWN